MSQHGCPGRVGRSHVRHAHRQPGAHGSRPNPPWPYARGYSRPTTARTASRAQTVAGLPRHVTTAVPLRAPLPRGQERPAPPAWGRGRRMPEIREETPLRRPGRPASAGEIREELTRRSPIASLPASPAGARTWARTSRAGRPAIRIRREPAPAFVKLLRARAGR